MMGTPAMRRGHELAVTAWLRPCCFTHGGPQNTPIRIMRSSEIITDAETGRNHLGWNGNQTGSSMTRTQPSEC